MTPDSPAIAPLATSEPWLEVLQSAITSYHTPDRPSPETVVTALLQAEKSAKQQHLTWPFADLMGTWQLCFTTGTRKRRQGGIALGKGFYLPRWSPAGIQFQSSEETAIAPFSHCGTVRNQIKVGMLQLKFTGPAKYLPQKNLLTFDFTQIQVQLFDATLYQGSFNSSRKRGQPQSFPEQAIAQLPFFSFFWVTPDGIAARGRGGGLALWMRSTDVEA